MKLSTGATRPAPIAFWQANFTGELCPYCGTQRLSAPLHYPVCNRCRERLGLDEAFLKRLEGHRIIVDQQMVNWSETPHAHLSGQIDNTTWEAHYASGRWLVSVAPVPGVPSLQLLVAEYLESHTPDWLEQAKSNKTAIRRWGFFVAIGVTIVAGGIMLKKRADSKKAEESDQDPA